MKRVSNRNARWYVQNRQAFKGSHTQGYWHETSHLAGDAWVISARYVVQSYGSHWPLFVYDEPTRTWYENKDRWSCTTSRHRSQLHPHTDTVCVSLDETIAIMLHGVVGAVARKLNPELEAA